MTNAAAEQREAIPAEAEFSAQEEHMKQLLLEAGLEEEDLAEQHMDWLMGDDESSVSSDDDEQLKATLLLAENFAAEEEQCQGVHFKVEESSAGQEHFSELLSEARESAADEEHAENLLLAVEESVREEQLQDLLDEVGESSEEEEQLNKLTVEDEEPAPAEEEHGEDHLLEAEDSSVEAEQVMHLLAEAEDSFAEQASPVEAEVSSGEEHFNEMSLDAKEEEEEKEEEVDDDELFKKLWAEAEAAEEPSAEWEQWVKAEESSVREEQSKSLPTPQDTIALKAGGMAEAEGIVAPGEAVHDESGGCLADKGRPGGLRAEDAKAQASPQSWRCKRLLSEVGTAGALGSVEVALSSSRVAAAPGRALASSGPPGPRLEEEEEEVEEAGPHMLKRRRRCPAAADSLGSL